MQDSATHLAAARLLARAWQSGEHLAALPVEVRPVTRADGYAVQALWPEVLGQGVAGWKIAATSQAGQQHIAVGGPIAGPVFAHRVHAGGCELGLAANGMRVAECEVVFRFGRTLAPRAQGYTRDEVIAAVAALHPGIEVPDSRFLQFERAGEAQLIADCACTNDMVVGAAVAPQHLDALPALAVRAEVSDGRSLHGLGSNALGDPVAALVWLVNELAAAGRPLQAGQFVTTGACVVPIPVLAGQEVQADFGALGHLNVRFS